MEIASFFDKKFITKYDAHEFNSNSNNCKLFQIKRFDDCDKDDDDENADDCNS